MKRILVMMGVLIFSAASSLYADSPFAEGKKLISEMETVLEEIKETVLKEDEAHARALSTSFGQSFLKLEGFSRELRAADRRRELAILEDSIRDVIRRNLSLLRTVRDYTSPEAQIGIDRAFSVYLEGAEIAQATVIRAIARELEADPAKTDDPAE